MPTYKKINLSGSNDGRPIKITATATAGTTIHTATSGAGQDTYDEVWLWAGSTSTSAVNCTFYIGGVADVNQDSLNVRIPAAFNGPVAILPGLALRNAVVITATAATADRINVWGYVNRLSGQA